MHAALPAFVGDIEQVPTAVSAIKVDGKRAYQRVRDGEDVELPARPVTVHELVPGPLRTAEGVAELDVVLRCSSGTYVRAIARDLGAALGVGGHLTALRRTAVGPFDLAVAHTLEELGERFALLPIADAARSSFAALDLDRGDGPGRPLRPQAGAGPGRDHRGLRPGRGVPGALRAHRPAGPGPGDRGLHGLRRAGPCGDVIRAGSPGSQDV